MKGHLLLVDDDINFRNALKLFLEIEGYEIEEAASIVEFQEKIKVKQIDLVLTDLRLGDPNNEDDFSGFEIAKNLVKMKIPCIFLTAFPTKDVISLALRSRGSEPLAEDFLSKTGSLQAVIDTINNVLKRYKETQEDDEVE
jgi:DNA-binding response OmpR family regulator